MNVLHQVYKNIPVLIKGLLSGVIFGPLITDISLKLLNNQPVKYPTNIIVYYIIAMVFFLFCGFLISALNIIHKQNIQKWDFHTIKNSSFIAAPMMGFYRQGKGKQYPSFRNSLNNIINLLSKECGIGNNYYAGQYIKSKKEFETSDVSIRKNFRELEEKEYFILIYPENNASSSVLVETGYALAYNKKSIYFFKEGVKVPYMLEGAANARKNIKIYTYKDFDDLEMIIKNNKMKLFDFS